MQLSSIQPFSPQLQFHLLRHFYQPVKDYLDDLALQLSLSSDEIHTQLNLPASKFKPEFAQDPLALYQRVKETKTEQWNIVHQTPVKTDYRILFEKEHWPNGIGEDAVLAINDADESQLKNIQYEKKDNFLLQTLQVHELPGTLELIIVLTAAGEAITAFPGRWLPPLNEDLIKQLVFLHT